MSENGTNLNCWREYQERLHRGARRRYLIRRIPWLGVYAACAFLILTVIFYTGPWIFAELDRENQQVSKKEKQENSRSKSFSKKDLPALFNGRTQGLPPGNDSFLLEWEGKKLTVETSFDTALQNYILNLLNRSLSHQTAVIVLRPDTGQILAMADYRKHEAGDKENLSLQASFPAASLFKIVAAAAAVEARGFTPDRAMSFRGMKHTLYKSQLKKSNGRYTHKTSFKKAFSGSINPVFGKIGIYDLGRGLMTEYANKFLFNHEIPFDLLLDKSSINIPEDDFGLAEIASGFNKKTLISPLHASLITAAVANHGTMMEPWFVRKVMDETGKVLYRSTPTRLASPIEEDTASTLKILMTDTVEKGTARKAFRSLKRKKIFKDMELGAKTGTVNDLLDKYKYDWLTAYALPGNGDKGICITVLAVHGEKLGIRARDLAREIINYHFRS